MAVKGIGSLNPHGGPILYKKALVASITVTEEDAVYADTTGYIALGIATTPVFGHVKGILQYDGQPVTDNGASADYAGSYTTASTNITSSTYVSCLIDVSKESLYSIDPDVAFTTTGSQLLGWRTDLADEDETDENTCTTGTAQYFIWGTDPADTGNQKVSIFESQVFGV